MSKVKNILIIDDNASSLDRLLHALDGSDDFKYITAEYLRPAIQKIKNEGPFDLILLDQNMGSWKTPDEVLDVAKKLAPVLENEVTSANRTGLLLLPWLVHAEINPLPKICIISQYGKTEIADKFAKDHFKEKFCGFKSKPIFLEDILKLFNN